MWNSIVDLRCGRYIPGIKGKEMRNGPVGLVFNDRNQKFYNWMNA